MKTTRQTYGFDAFETRCGTRLELLPAHSSASPPDLLGGLASALRRWEPAIAVGIVIFFILLLLGGCAGSTANGGLVDVWAGDDALQASDAADPGDDTTVADDTGDDALSEGDEPPSPVVGTNQSMCYDDLGCSTCPDDGAAFSGQDAQYQGLTAVYQDNGDGTVTDVVTGLVWQKTPTIMTYAEAAAGADDVTLAGYDDWRLPTIEELYSLMQFSGLDPSGCQAVEDCALVPFIDSSVFDFEYGDVTTGVRLIDAQYATSTIYESTTMGGDETMFGVNFADGRIKGYPTDPMPGQEDGKLFYVLYVRGEAYGESSFVDQGDGTILDTSTGLTWMKADSGSLGAGSAGDGTMDWEDALAWCETLEYGGHDDWRLPDAKELQGIVDYTRSPATTNSAAIDPVFEATSIVDEGGATNWAFYWTSTTHVTVTSTETHGAFAAYIAFGEALGWMETFDGDVELMDVHGAGAQRSDPKTGDPDDYPYGHGPQGDVIRIYNMVRCVTGGGVTSLGGGAACVEPAAAVSCGAAQSGSACCGDGACDPVETTSSCPSDCGGGGDSCGDGTCAEGEESSCPEDCGGELPGGTSCTTQDDCDAPEACPPDAELGCTCATTLFGDQCIPLCDTDSDCPAPPDETLICGPEGVCIPSGG